MDEYGGHRPQSKKKKQISTDSGYFGLDSDDINMESC